VEIYDGAANEQGFAQLFGALTDAMVGAIRENHAVENPEIVSAFFETSRNILLFSPNALFHSSQSSPDASTLDTILQICAYSLRSDLSEALGSLFLFLQLLCSKVNDPTRSGKFSHFKPIFDQAFLRQGLLLVKELLRGLAATLPSAYDSKLSGVLAELTREYPAPIQEWTYATMVNSPQDFASLSDQNKEAVIAMVPELQASTSKAKEIFVHVAKACRKDMAASEFQEFLKEAHESLLAIAVANSVPNESSNPAVIDISFLD
jgi:hypothetical protein